MIIHNNLICQNRENGIMVTSFNLSKIIITNNTIDGNNKESKSRIIFGRIKKIIRDVIPDRKIFLRILNLRL